MTMLHDSPFWGPKICGESDSQTEHVFFTMVGLGMGQFDILMAQ